jgi:hypothetical protein
MTSGLSGPAFDICLLEGQVEEHAVAHILCKATFEVKNDKRARETGNVFVEFRQGSTIKGEGRPSGICITEAAWYVFKVQDDALIFIETERLKQICREQLGKRDSVMGGDFNKFEGVLVPLTALIAAPTKEPLQIAA